MPLGGAKGFALALAVEVLTGALLGPAVGPEIADFFSDEERPQGIAHLVVALDPAAFGEAAAFAERIARLADAVLNAGETRLPGSRGAAHADAADGMLQMSDGLARTLSDLARELGTTPIVSGS
jgi:(2R)-3-sulfolactate dehydrogenase (NADP+)